MKSSVILLAAGASTRMGQPKALLDFKGKYWIDYQIESLRQIGFKKILVVLGFSNELITSKMKSTNIELIFNPTPEAGQFSSVQVGLKMARGGACFVLPIDVPAPQKQVWLEMEGAMDANFVQPSHQGRLGHPIRLGDSLIETLVHAPSESRLDALLAQISGRKVVATEDSRVLLNLNTPEAFHHWVQESNRRFIDNWESSS
jgi:CTP:molybdopterin cytidylyltransferase MocA